jgi:hypothetical protein
MNARAQANHKNDFAQRRLSLTPDFSPVVTGSGQEKPFKRLHVSACAGTRLNPGVNEK